jgi:hypothetical protein
MSEPLSSRIAEAKARAEERQAFYNHGSHSMTDLVAADVLFLADQLARAHAVIEAARIDFKDMRRLMDHEGRSGYTADMASAEERCARYLADFDRGEQGMTATPPQ